MTKILLVTLAMLISGSCLAGPNVVVPPITRWANVVPLPPKRPDNFGKIDNNKVNNKIDEVIKKGK